MSVKQSIERKLFSAIQLDHLDVLNESHQHNVPPNSETHFKLVLVSSDFIGKRQVARHQMVYKVLQEELDGPVHALALHTYTADEWQQSNGNAPLSPPCMGGENI